jgi:hypothetical protein
LSSEIDLQLEDCAPILAELLKHWPSDVFMLTESVSITPESISIRGSTPESQDVQKLADSLGVLRGWQMQQPQVSSGAGGGGKDGVQASLRAELLEGLAEARRHAVMLNESTRDDIRLVAEAVAVLSVKIDSLPR